MSSHVLLDQADLSLIPRGSCIVEIGCVRDQSQFESGDNSTVYFDRLSQKHGYGFFSVDFSKDSIAYSRKIVGGRAVQSDGAVFLKDFQSRIGILYLDNFDVVYNDKHKASLLSRVGTAYEDNNEELSNQRSAEVHLEQLKAALPKMTEVHYIGIDDTMIRDGGWWGKGATCVPYLESLGYRIMARSDDGVLMTRAGCVRGAFK